MGAPSLQKATLRQLNTFTTVARLGSLSAAARELHISQPAVSMQLRDLEEQCGVALYERAGRKIALTDAGLEVAKCGAAVCEHLRETEEKLADMLGLKTGLLRLDAVTTAKYFSPALLAAFQRQYEAISIRFSVGNREEITRRLSENECDLVIMGRPPKIKDVVAQPFAPHPLVFVAAASHPLVDENSIPLERLAREKLLARESGSGTRANMEELFARNDTDIQIDMELSSNETIKHAVIAGMGIAFLSVHTLGSELSTGRIKILNVAGLPLQREWQLVHRASKRLSPVASMFREFVLKEGNSIIEETVGT